MSEVTENTEQQMDAEQPGLRELIKRYPGLQAQIDRIVEERLKRERAGFETKLGEEVSKRTAELQAKIRELSSPAKDEVQQAVQQAREESAAEREAIAAKAAEWEQRYKQGLAQRVLLEAAVKHGAHRPSQVVDLLVNKIHWQDGEGGPAPVLDLPEEEGQPGASYAGGDIGKGVAAYLAANPNLVAAGSGPGAGGRPGVPSLPVTAEALRGLSVEQLRRLRPDLERLASSLGR